MVEGGKPKVALCKDLTSRGMLCLQWTTDYKSQKWLTFVTCMRILCVEMFDDGWVLKKFAFIFIIHLIHFQNISSLLFNWKIFFWICILVRHSHCASCFPAPHPTSRWGHTMCLTDNNTAVVVGGQGERQQLSKDSVWCLNTGQVLLGAIIFFYISNCHWF